jgi:4-hydroxy-tetrahydrodipicolinate synthase
MTIHTSSKSNHQNGLSPFEREFNGVWTAIVTPFKDDHSIDWHAWEKLLAMQAEGGVSGVVVSGTTGESPTLSVQEKISLVRKARAVLPKTIRVMAGSGGNNTEQSVELSRLCVDAGADSLLVVTPPYNKPSPEGLKLHFTTIAESVNVPLCLYHVPGRTGQLLPADVLASLCAIKGISSVKEATGDVAFLSRVRNRTRKSGTAFLSGDDITFLPALAVGATGVISVLSNIFPGELVKLAKAWESGDSKRALEIHDIMQPLMDALFCESNPGPAKYVLSRAGIIANSLRAPLAPVTAASAAMLDACVSTTRSALK